MKRLLLSVATVAVAITTTLAQTKVNDKITIYELDNSKLHVYQTGDAMGDVSFVVEGEKSLVILEQPLFWSNIEEFNSYVEGLDKPIDKVVANYHFLGLANYPSSKVMVPAQMIEFSKSPMAQGMLAKFQKGFGEAADFRMPKKMKGFAVPSTQKWGGVEMTFIPGNSTDFPAASIHIDGKAFYTHFAVARGHANPMQLKSRESLTQILDQLQKMRASGAEYIVASHGPAATQAEVDFQIEYFETVQRLLDECPTSDLFGQRLIVAFPSSLPGIENVKAISKALYSDEKIDDEVEALRGRMNDYLSMVSDLDLEIAKGLWATSGNISIITPRSQFFGFESIMNDFLIKAFSSFQSRKLSSLSEVINIYGDSANIQLYWNFDTVDAKGEKRQGRGRESLIFSKCSGEWRLVHVHYSPMPL
ncbi:MAG: nuclear transport factor 2 family protein [Rikenellaceae bacterium]